MRGRFWLGVIHVTISIALGALILYPPTVVEQCNQNYPICKQYEFLRRHVIKKGAETTRTISQRPGEAHSMGVNSSAALHTTLPDIVARNRQVSSRVAALRKRITSTSDYTLAADEHLPKGKAVMMNRTLPLGTRRRVLIHVGKCGGGTWRKTGIFHFEVHVNNGKRFRPAEQDHLYITLRDPIERTISAWKWRKLLLSHSEKSKEKCSSCRERACLTKFGDINEVGELLNHTKAHVLRRLFLEKCIHHIGENYEWYLGHLLKYIFEHPARVGLLRMERLRDDGLRLFNRSISTRSHVNSKRTASSVLSTSAWNNLRSLLDAEYRIYYQLLALKGLRQPVQPRKQTDHNSY
eukprot:gb/GECG01008365.1/.p1 GENE.gb/GECG01008365.1/~~gb/GECG01008365.1/.p1  ORF type:complete len:351 (+),score=23.48 gb/GECG01008365.1/:1-1053(+)